MSCTNVESLHCPNGKNINVDEFAVFPLLPDNSAETGQLSGSREFNEVKDLLNWTSKHIDDPGRDLAGSQQI